MATTTNFGWETPDDTDLVKDGALAMRTLGNAIDASLVDLKGGTTGQILSKTSNTDMDFTWITNDVGDITAVTAGTGISGGGTSGAVTITNDMATTITASGDIIVGTGSGTYDNLPIGTTGQVLTADTTVSPYKVKWASAGTAFSGVSVTRDSNQSIPNNTTTKIAFNSENYDTDSYHDNSTNNTRLTVPTGKSGKYSINYIFSFSGFNGNINVGFYKNNAFYTLTDVFNTANTTNYWTSAAFTVNLTAGDYLEMTFYQNSGGNLDVRGTDTQVQMTYLGA